MSCAGLRRRADERRRIARIRGGEASRPQASSRLAPLSIAASGCVTGDRYHRARGGGSAGRIARDPRPGHRGDYPLKADEACISSIGRPTPASSGPRQAGERRNERPCPTAQRRSGARLRTVPRAQRTEAAQASPSLTPTRTVCSWAWGSRKAHASAAAIPRVSPSGSLKSAMPGGRARTSAICEPIVKPDQEADDARDSS